MSAIWLTLLLIQGIGNSIQTPDNHLDKLYEIIIKVDVSQLPSAEQDKAMEQTLAILQYRVKIFNLQNVVIKRIDKSSKVSIRFPITDDLDKMKDIMLQEGKIEFWELYSDNLLEKGFTKLKTLLGPNQREKNTPSAKFRILSKNRINAMIRQESTRKLFPAKARFFWEAKADQQGDVELLVAKNVDGKPSLEGDIVQGIYYRKNEQNPMFPHAFLLVIKTDKMDIWKQFTREKIGRRVAMVIDNQAYFAATIRSQITSNRTEISGGFTKEEIVKLSKIVNAGKLPRPVQLIEEKTVNSGKD